MRSLRRRRAITALLVAGVFACGSPHPESSGGPVAVRVLEVELHESDSVFLSRPTSVLRHDSGLFVADLFQNRIVQFDPVTGLPVRILGRRGGGPGEFLQIGHLFAFGDTLVGAVDLNRRTFTFFDQHTGGFAGRRSFEGWAGQPVHIPGGLVFGNVNMNRNTAVAIWFLRGDSVSYGVPLADEYRRSQELAGIFSGSIVASWDDTLLVAMSGLNRLEYYSWDGRSLGRVELPVRRRKGVPPDIVERLKMGPGRTFEDLFSMSSAVMALHRTPTGRVYVIHSDQTIRVQGRLITGISYVSVVSPDRTRACVDGQLDVTQDAQPKFTFRGDTLFVLEQRMRDEGVRTTLSGYLIDTSECSWLELQAYDPTS